MNPNLLDALRSQDPGLEIQTFDSEGSFGVAFYHPQGFKDLGTAVVAGFFRYGSEKGVEAVLREIQAWARSKNASGVVGPLNYSTYLDYRLKTNHFERVPFLGEPDHPRWVVAVFERQGFKPILDYESRVVRKSRLPAETLEQLRAIVREQGLESKFKFSRVERESLIRDLPQFFALSENIFSDNFAFRNIPYPVFQQGFMHQLLPAVCFETSYYMANAKGERVGFALNFKDTRDSRRLLIKTAGVIPSERMMGLSFLALMSRVLESALAHYDEFEFCLMKKGNFPDFLSSELGETPTRYQLFRSS